MKKLRGTDAQKHQAPLLCRMRRIRFGVSPSALLSRCALGVQTPSAKCKGCEENVREAWYEGFQEGLKRGQENPIYKIDENLQIVKIREETPEELAFIQKCKQIAAHSFGLPNDEEVMP